MEDRHGIRECVQCELLRSERNRDLSSSGFVSSEIPLSNLFFYVFLIE